MLFTLVDLTVLNLFVQYGDQISISSFSISLVTAVLLQSMLNITLAIERRIADLLSPTVKVPAL